MNHSQYQLAGACAVQPPPDDAAHHDGHCNQYEVIAYITEVTEFDHAKQHIGFRYIERIDAPDQLGDIFQYQEQGKGHQH